MACSIRTGAHLTLDLPRLFWKQLVGQEYDLDDLEEIDKPLCDLMKFMESCSREMFEEQIFETFQTVLSDGTVVQLKPRGAQQKVLFDERYDFILRMVQAKVRESNLQIEAIKKGLSALIPLPFLKTVTAADLESWVCGKKRVDIEMLRRHTRYSGGLTENSPVIQFFWEVLEEITDTEKLLFIKFCWGQERLPANDEEFERNSTRLMIRPSLKAAKNPNKALPKADTCFFNLELPNYTTKEALKERLMIAITFDSDAIDADELIQLDPNAQGNQEHGWDSSFDQEEEY